MDVWLIYRCASCGETWNLPILERLPIGKIPPDELRAFAANDPAHAARHAFDLERLRRHSDRVEQGPEVAIVKRLTSGNPVSATSVEIEFMLGRPCRLRLDGLLSRGLGVTRSLIGGLHGSAALTTAPANGKALRSPVIDGQRVRISLEPATTLTAEIRKAAAP